MYAIIDIETTGLSPANEKITEVAIIIHDGQKIINEYSTLINPEKKSLMLEQVELPLEVATNIFSYYTI